MAELFASRKNDIKEEVTKQGCLNYVGCSICFKCIRKASHLNEDCYKCGVPICLHKQSEREYMIRPQNFTSTEINLVKLIKTEWDKYSINKENENANKCENV